MKPVRAVIRFGLRRGWSRGVLEGSPTWAVLGGLALLSYLADRYLRREPEVVFSEKLRPGEAIRVIHEARS